MSSDIKPARIAASDAVATVFVCANCARPGQKPDSGGRPRPVVPDFRWPVPVAEVLVSCTGRIQPEHILKAFENGARLVAAVACEDDNCHFLEGSKRCARRVDYLRGILDDIGLGGERLMLLHLPGTAAEDTILGCGGSVACTIDTEDPRVIAVRDAIVAALDALVPNPLEASPLDEEAEDAYLEVDDSDESNEE
jgi:coenzyme F420-reducing hydrogenase delta subunit